MDRITKTIADYASSLTFEQLDEATVQAATQRLIDTVGCAVAAHDCDSAATGRRIAAGQGAGRYAGYTLFSGERLPPEAAAFINTAMIRNFDFNDRYPGGHPSDALGALIALAAASTAPVDGRRFLAAMVVMYEIFARLCDATRFNQRGWDQGFAISIAAACGLCNLLRLPRAAAANAIGIAASSSVPLRVTRSGELTPWKGAATAYAVRNGVFAALLAAEGMAGPPEAFAGRAGLFENVTGPFELEPFATAGGRSLMTRVEIKYWPVEASGQPVVWAALELRKSIVPSDLKEIEFLVNRFAKFEIGSEPAKWDPQTRETADHSLPYIFARTLADGPITLRAFTREAVLDPVLRPIMAKVTVTADEAMEAMLPRMGLRARATTVEGREHSVEIVDPLGQPANPMQDKDIEAKFSALAAPYLGTQHCRGVLDAFWRVRDAGNIGELLGLLEVPVLVRNP
jgi:2-methylcitrate dehydratase